MVCFVLRGAGFLSREKALGSTGIRLKKWASCVLFSVLVSALAERADATSFSAQILDPDGHPLPFAVLTLTPASGETVAASPPPALMGTYIDQKDETFVPYVVAIMRGGSVTFRNSDTTRHHVYTFAEIHPFEFILKPGDISPPQRFDKAGIAAIGCNIHDQMIAYVYVSATPLTAVSDTNGIADIPDVPAGSYQAEAWYPQLKPHATVTQMTVTVGQTPIKLSLSVAAIPHVDESMDDMDGMN